jgi:hypothetical protein
MLTVVLSVPHLSLRASSERQLRRVVLLAKGIKHSKSMPQSSFDTTRTSFSLDCARLGLVADLETSPSGPCCRWFREC